MTHRPNKVDAVGVLTVEKFRDGDETPYETLTEQNSLTVAGRQHLLELGSGINTSNKLDASSVLRIINASATLVRTLTGLEATYPSHTTGSGYADVTLRWRDGGVNTYPAYTMEVWFEGNTIQLNTLTPNFGTKPSNEAWVYTFTLTFNVGSSSLVEAGLNRWLECASGVVNTTFDAARTELQVYSTWDGDTGTIIQAWIVPDTGPTRASETISWVWVLGNGEAEGAWAGLKVRNSSSDVKLRSGTTTAGTKAAFISRTYTYNVSI